MSLDDSKGTAQHLPMFRELSNIIGHHTLYHRHETRFNADDFYTRLHRSFACRWFLQNCRRISPAKSGW